MLKRLSTGPKPTAGKNQVQDARLKLMRKQTQGRTQQDARLRLEMKRKSRSLPMSLLSNRLGNPLLSPVDHILPIGGPPLVRTVANRHMLMPRHFDWDRPVEDDEMEIVPSRFVYNLD